MPQELLFELNGARVTPHIATFGGTSYQISNIGSVRVMQRKKYNPLAVIIFVLGLGILVAAMVKSHMTGPAEESFSMAATGIAVVPQIQTEVLSKPAFATSGPIGQQCRRFAEGDAHHIVAGGWLAGSAGLDWIGADPEHDRVGRVADFAASPEGSLRPPR
jgi:Family of unknown function (DUF6232)